MVISVCVFVGVDSFDVKNSNPIDEGNNNGIDENSINLDNALNALHDTNDTPYGVIGNEK